MNGSEETSGEVPRRRRVGRIVAAGLAVVMVVVVVFAVLAARELGREVPEFESLTRRPDPSLHGTVAYFAGSGCVRVVAAAGRPQKDVLCLPSGQDVAEAEKLGKEIGPQLVWLPDGRLQVTMFRMPDLRRPSFARDWQKIVDVRTGEVENVPAAEVPSAPDLTTRATVDPSGERITTSTDPQSGRIKIVLTDAHGRSRTLLSARGPGNYTYSLRAAFWSPDWRWIAADDGRILVVTPGEPAVTRVLADDRGDWGFGGDDPRLSAFAVTADDILTSGR